MMIHFPPVSYPGFAGRCIPLLVFFFVLIHACKRDASKDTAGRETRTLLPDTVILEAANHMGLPFDQKERDQMSGGLGYYLRLYEEIRSCPLTNSIPPAIQFNPIPVGANFSNIRESID